jgi:hypothetical protein
MIFLFSYQNWTGASHPPNAGPLKPHWNYTATDRAKYDARDKALAYAAKGRAACYVETCWMGGFTDVSGGLVANEMEAARDHLEWLKDNNSPHKLCLYYEPYDTSDPLNLKTLPPARLAEDLRTLRRVFEWETHPSFQRFNRRPAQFVWRIHTPQDEANWVEAARLFGRPLWLSLRVRGGWAPMAGIHHRHQYPSYFGNQQYSDRSAHPHSYAYSYGHMDAKSDTWLLPHNPDAFMKAIKTHPKPGSVTRVPDIMLREGETQEGAEWVYVGGQDGPVSGIPGLFLPEAVRYMEAA